MKKFLLGVFILFNLALIAGGGYVLYTYLSHLPSRAPSFIPLAPIPSTPRSATPSAPSTAPNALGSTASAPPAPSGVMSHAKIFSYRNSHAKHVEIRADFTGWKAEPMKRDASGVWTYRAVLSPGEYAYCFSVDDKPPLKDPVNKRTKMIGRAIVSAIVVEDTPPKSPK